MYEKRGVKVCVIGPSDYFCSGTAIYTITLINSLLASGQYEVLAVLIRKLSPRFLYPGRDHIGKQQSPQPIDRNVKVYQEMDWYSPLSWIHGFFFLKRNKPDIIIMQWWTSATLHILLFFGLLNMITIKSKLIIELHEVKAPLEMGNVLIRLYARMISPVLMKCANVYMTHNSTVKKEAIQTYKLKEDEVFSIPVALYDFHEPLTNKSIARQELNIKEKFIILHFGMIRKYKGLPFLIQAFNSLPETVARSSRLLIAGEDWKEDVVIEDLVKRSPYREQITFDEGYIPNEKVPKYFSAADVVVFPHTETCGSAAVSLAMAYGKPILASDLTAMRELVAGYGGVSFFSPGNVAAIGRCIENFFYETGKSSNIPSYEPPKTGWPVIIRKYAEIINKLLLN